jgi:hypothetical protein
MRRGLIMCLIVLGALIGFSVTTGSASAADTPVTLEPGATVRIPIRLWCLDFGKPFPTSIAGPVSRPPDAAFLVLQAALARGATESDPYQTQLAIWRATDGTFHDPAGVGYVLAQQIYSDSLKLTVSPVPTNTLESAVSQGSVKVTFENFKAISDTVHSELLPYTGTADLVVLNTSSESVTFIPVDGMVFDPASDTSEQTLISHLDVPIAPTTLPVTGGATPQDARLPSLLFLVLAASLLRLGVWIARAW